MNQERQIPRLWISTVTIVALVALWFAVTNLGLVGPTYLPSPQDLVKSFGHLVSNGYQRAPLWEHIGISLFRALTGFALGVAVGIPTGLVTGYMRSRRRDVPDHGLHPADPADRVHPDGRPLLRPG